MISKYSKKKITTNFFIITLIFFFDRITKILVLNLDKKKLEQELFTSTFIDISLIWNNGIAFGLLSFDENYIYNISSE